LDGIVYNHVRLTVHSHMKVNLVGGVMVRVR